MDLYSGFDLEEATSLRLTDPPLSETGNGVSIGGEQRVFEQQLWNEAQTGACQG